MSTQDYAGTRITQTIDADVWAEYDAADHGADASELWGQLVDATRAALEAAFPGAEIVIREEPRQSGGPDGTRVYLDDEAFDRLGYRSEDQITDTAREIAGRVWQEWTEALPGNE